jgi:hypothetical protein
MKRVTTVILLIVESILISSCIASEQLNPTSTHSLSATQERAATDFMPTTMLTASQTPTAAMRIVDICPSSRFVPLQELEIPDQFRLIVMPPDLERHGDYEMGYSLIVPSDSKVEEVYVSPPANTANQDYIISPNGQWISFLRQPLNDSTNRTLWISSLNGEEQWEVKQFPETFRSYQWISEDEIVIWGPQNYDAAEPYPPPYNYIPLAVINPFTFEVQLLPPLPQKYIDEKQDQMYVFRSSTLYYMFMLMQTEGYFLRSYKDNSIQQIFEWLNGHGNDSYSTRVHREGDLITIKVDQPYGFDLSPNLSVSDITQQQDYSKIMRKIVLPTEFGPLRATDMLPQTNLWNLFQKRDIDSTSPVMYFTLDPQNMNLTNYCFEINWGSYIMDSPDGNFIAISRDYAGDEYPKGEIIILNLKSGYASVIEGYQLLGWGVQK